MELDFSFFGFSPKPKTKKIGTTSTNEDYPKLSLKKKCNLKIQTSIRHEPAGTVKECMPRCDNTLQFPLSSCQINTSTEDYQEKENTDPSFSAGSQHTSICHTSQNESLYKITNCKSLRNVLATSGSDSSSSNRDINIMPTAKKLSSGSSPCRPTLPPKHDLQGLNHDVTTIVTSDSSICSNSTGGSIYTSSDRSRSKSKELLKDLQAHSRLHNTGTKNKHYNVSSYASLFEALPNSNKSEEHISSGVVISSSNKKILLPSERDSISGTSSNTNTTGCSSFNVDIDKNAAIGVIPNIVLETSDSETETEQVPHCVLTNLSVFPQPSRNILNDDKEEICQMDIIGCLTQLQTPHMTTSKFQEVQKWLETSEPSALETDVSLICNSKESSFSCRPTTNVSDAEEPNSKNVLSLSAENVLNQLYGPAWKKSSTSTSTKKSQTVGRNSSHKLTSKEIDGSFDEFLKKFDRNRKLTTKKLPDAVITTDFINDDSLSNESLGFYQALLNSEKDTPPGRNQEAGTSEELSKVKHLPISNRPNRKLYFSDEDEDSVDTPLVNSITVQAQQQSIEGENPAFIKKQCVGEFQPEETNVQVNKKKTDHTNTQKSVQLKMHTCVRSLQVRSFLESLSASTPESCCHPEAHYFKSNFKKRKEELCVKLFTMYNSKVFGSALPKDLKIEWNVRLQRTAGLCFNRRVLEASGEKVRTSRIELSTKVCDSPDRLRDTLIHELCHAATWIVNAVQGGHGHFWKVWSVKAMQGYPELPPIKRCHDYKIQTKFTYKCCDCGYCVDRHSKSLNIDTKRCGYCHGKFELFVNYKSKAGAQLVETPKTPRNPNGFALYVKQNYGSLKSTRKNLKHGDVMKLLGQQFSAAKIS